MERTQKLEERSKARERLEKEYKEMKDMAMRIVVFISEDEEIRKMTPSHIKDILDMASGIISKAAGCITFDQLCDIYAQMAKGFVPKQPACQGPHPTS